jgi:hypothetical protein
LALKYVQLKRLAFIYYFRGQFLRYHYRKNGACEGFLLIEVMTTLCMFTAFASIIALYQMHIMQQQRQARMHGAALSYVDDCMEQMVCNERCDVQAMAQAHDQLGAHVPIAIATKSEKLWPLIRVKPPWMAHVIPFEHITVVASWQSHAGSKNLVLACMRAAEQKDAS